jgi:UDP-glucose 4-epimerase
MVTGGAGFIGSHLVDRLLDEEPETIIIVDNLFLGKKSNLDDASRRAGLKIRLYEQDASDLNTMKQLLIKHNINVVFNLAVIPLPASLESPKMASDTNMEIVSTLCELQKCGHFQTLINFSSSEAYGTARYRPMDELHPLGPSTPYSASKAGGDLLALSYYRCFGTDVSVIRPFNNYGPRQNEGSYAGVIPLTIKRILNGSPPLIYGDGLQTRDFVYVRDTAKMAIEMCKQNEKVRGLVLNCAANKEVRILDLVKLIMQEMGYDGHITFAPERPGDVKLHRGSGEQAKVLLGFHAETSFDEGIRKTVRWYLGL